MGLDCNVIPQIKVSDTYVDSKCFIELWDRAKKLYPFNPIKARVIAKADYETLKSNEFISENGDWVLLRAIQNNQMIDAQIATFQSLYGNNIERLKKSITVPLNEQGEPEISQLYENRDIKKSEILYEADYPFVPDSEQMCLNRIFAVIAFRSESEFTSLNYKDFKDGIKIRNIIAKVLRQYASNTNSEIGYLGYSTQLKEYRNRRAKELKVEGKTNDEIKTIIQSETIYKDLKRKADNLIELADQLDNLDNKGIWQNFINYYKAEFLADINDFDIEDHMTMGELNGITMTDEQNLNKSWNSSLQFKVNRKNTASSRFKRMIMEVIYNNQSNLMNTVSDSQLNGTASYASKYGLAMPFDLDLLWTSLIDVTRYASNKLELINSLKVLSDSVYNGQLKGFIDKLEIFPSDSEVVIDKKEDFYNMYMASVDMATTIVTESEIMNYNGSGNDYVTAYQTKELNRQSFAMSEVYNRYRSILNAKFQYSSDKASIGFNISNLYRTGIDFTDKINSLLLKSNNFGINWDLSTIFNYLSIKFKLPYDIIKILYSEGNKNNIVNNVVYQKIDKELSRIDRVYDEITKQLKTVVTDKKDDVSKESQATRVRNLLSGIRVGDNVDSKVDQMKGRINTLATVGCCDPSLKVDLTYINVEGEQEYTPEFYNHITAKLQGLINRVGDVNVELMKYRFADFLKSKGTKYNSLIWNLGDGLGGDGKGFFNFAKDSNGNAILDEDGYRILHPTNPVNIEAVKAFQYARFNGISNKDTGKGMSYVDMHDYVWTRDVILRQFNGRYSLPSADASRIYEFFTGNIVTEINSSVKCLGTKFFGKNGRFISYENAKAKGLENNFTYQRVKDTLRAELEMMLQSRQLLFDYNPETQKLSIKKEFLRSEEDVRKEFNELDSEKRADYIAEFNGDAEAAFAKYYEDNSADLELFEGLQSPIFWNGKAVLVNGKPTGNVFKLGNLSFRYTDANGNTTVRDVTDYIEDAFKELHPEALGSFGKFEPFMICGEDFSTAYGDVIDSAFMRMFIDRMNSQLKDTFEYLEPVRDSIQSTITYKNQLKVVGEELPSDYKEDHYWAFVCANLLCNHYTTDINIQELFTGYTFEFKNAIDWAKRASQGVRPGAKTRATTTYTQIIAADVELVDNMIDEIVIPFLGKDEETVEIIKQRFGTNKINTADAFNVITEKECIARFRALGEYDSFTLPSGRTLKDIIEDEETPIDPRDYARIVEQLKYYYYDRGKSTLNNKFNTDFIFSHQDKNSTVVIFKRMYKGTRYETLADWMNQEGIDSINFASGHKVGAMPKVYLFKIENSGKDAVLNIDYNEETKRFELKGYPKGVDAFKHTLKHTNLYTQQQVPSHIMDEQNKIGTQLEKRILDNLLFDEDYVIDGVTRKGKTGDKSYESAGVFEHYQMLLANNGSDEMFRLLQDWGAVDEQGNIKYKTIGTEGGPRNIIEVDTSLILADLRRYFTESDIDRNFIKATTIIDGKPFMPFYHPTIKNRIESVLLARITKRVTNLKMKGAHVTIQPDTFTQPASVTIDKNGLIKGTQANVSRLYNEGKIKFSDDFWKARAELDENGNIKRNADGSPIIKKDADFKLRSEGWDEVVQEDGSLKRVFRPAEIILNCWDSRFKLDENGNLDLNTVPENLRTMFGIRIPTEGHQSMFVAKVVGVLNNGASQAIVPEHLVTRTGWDYDIDSIYLAMKDFEYIDGKYIEYKKNDSKTYKRQSLEYVSDIYFAKAKDELKKAELKDKIPLINSLSEINAQIDKFADIDTSVIDRLKREYSDLQKQRFVSRNISERNTLAKEMEDKAKEIEEYNKSGINPAINNTELSGLYAQKSELLYKLKEVNKKHSEAYETFLKETVEPKWNTLNEYQRMPRAAKDNAIIDTWIGIHSDVKNTLNKERPNEFEHSTNTARYINKHAGYDNSMMNQHFLIDQIKIRNMNNNIAVLKGQSIAADNALSIMGLTQTQLTDEFAIPIKLNFHDIKGFSEDIPNKIQWVKEKLLKTFKDEKLSNGERAIDIDIKNNTVTIWCRSLYNNDYGTWTDINDEKISDQRSELTSHILDAVKENLWFNLSTYTIGNTALLASFPISWNVNLESNGTKLQGTNRYIYSALLESQQIIVDFVTNISVKSLNNPNNYTNVSFHNVRSNYMINLVSVLGKLLENNNSSLSEFAKKYFTDNKDLTGLKDTIIKLAKYIKDINSNRSLSKSHEYGHSIVPNQVDAMSDFIKALQEELNLTQYDITSNVKYKAKTVNELDALFKSGIDYKTNIENLEEYANYLSNQLEVLDYYMYVDKAVNAMKRAQACLTTEKRGAGPKTSESNKLFESIAGLEYNINTLLKDAEAAKVPESMRNDLLYKYYSVNEITDKRDVIDDWLDEVNEYLSYRVNEVDNTVVLKKPVSPFRIGNQSMIEAIFPSIRNKDWKIEDSAYPILQQQLFSTNEISVKLFHDFFISENPMFKDKINYCMAKLNRVNDPELREDIVNYAIIDNIRNMPFFSNESISPEAQLIARSKLLGCVNIIEDDKGFMFKGTTDLSLSNVNLKYWIDEVSHKPYTHEEKIKKFKELPVGIQLAIVKNTLTDGKYVVSNGQYVTDGNLRLNPNHILSLLTPNTIEKNIIRTGFILINTKESDDIDYTRDTFFQLINSPDEYCRILGENLVRYAFWVNSFDFGRNLSKYIPIDLYGKMKTDSGEYLSAFKTSWGEQFDSINFESIDGTSDAEIRAEMRLKGIINGSNNFRSETNALYHYANSLYASMNEDTSILLRRGIDLNEFVEAFVRAHSDNSKIVKTMKSEYTTVKENDKRVTRIKDNTPTFKKITKSNFSKNAFGLPGTEKDFHKDVTEETREYIEKALNSVLNNAIKVKHNDVWNIINQMIFEPTDYVLNSEFASDYYLKSREKSVDNELDGLTNKDKTKLPVGVLYKRFDINDCTFYYPINKTFKSEYIYTANDYFKYNVEAPEVYEKLATILSKFYRKFNMSVNNIEKHSSLTDAIDGATNNADYIIYVGSESDTNRGLIKGNSIKTISLQSLIQNELDLESLPANINNLALFANGEPLSQLKRLIVQGDIFKSLEAITEHLNPMKISAVQADGVNDIIVDYLGIKHNIETTVHTINTDTTKFSTILDTRFVADDNTGLSTSNLEFINTLYEVEKTAIGNTKLLRNEMILMGDLNTDLANLESKAKIEIDKLGKDISSLQAYIDTFAYNAKVLENVKDMLNAIDIDLSPSTISALWTKGNSKVRKQWVTDLNKLNSLVKSQVYIEDLNPIDEASFENASQNMKDIVREFNETLLGLKGLYAEIMPIKEKVTNAANFYFAELINQKAHTPKFKTKFKYIQDKLAENGFDAEAIDEYVVTERDVHENIRRMLSDNLDLSPVIKWLDSAAQTGIPIIDTVLAQYESHMINAQEFAMNYTIRTRTLFKEFPTFYKEKSNGGVDTKFSQFRSNEFRDKFINDKNAQLVTPFDNTQAAIDYQKLKSKLHNDYIKELTELEKDLESNDIITVKIAQDAIARLTEKHKKDLEQIPGRTVYSNLRVHVPAKFDGRLELVLDDVYANPKKYFPKLTESEAYYYTKLIERTYKSKIRKKFAEVNNIKLRLNRQTTNKVTLDIRICDNQYRDTKFARLSKSEIDMLVQMQELFVELNDFASPNTIMNANFFPTFISANIKDTLKQGFGWRDLQEDDYMNTLSGEIQYYYKAPALNRPKVIGTIKYDLYTINNIDAYNKLIERANKIAKHRNYNKAITSISDIIDYNEYLRTQQMNVLKERMNYDPLNVVLNYINQLKDIKVKRDFEPELNLLQTVLASPEFKAREYGTKGKNVINKILSLYTKKPEVVSRSGKETYAFERFKDWYDAFEGKNRVTSTTDQILNLLHTVNSKSLMWMNLTAALKNVGTGHINIVSEATGGEFTTRKTLLKAHGMYIKALPALFSSLGEYTCNNLDAALIKLSGNIFEDHVEAGVENKTNIVSFGMAKWDNIMFSPNSMGEHYLQFTTFLSAMQTHKIVDGAIMNYDQFVFSLRDKLFKDMVNEETYKRYEEYVKRQEDYKGNNVEFIDYISRFIAYKQNNFTKAWKKEFANKYKEGLKDAKKKFEVNHKTLHESFELKNGIASLKEDSGITMEDFAKFLGKVKGVNHSLHGIYNSFDRAALAGKMWGEVILQFRKWLRPNFIRYWGKRVGKIIYDERLESYRSGAYMDMIQFITENGRNSYRETIDKAIENGEDIDFATKAKAIFNMFCGLMYWFKDISFRYNTLPQAQKANIRRAVFNLAIFAGLTLCAGAMYAASDDDDELSESALFALASYTIYGIQTELYETSPHGLYSFYKRTMEAPVPFETSLSNVTNLLYWTLIAPMVLNEEDLYYDRGTYKDESKQWIAFKKSIPLLNQHNKLLYLPKNNTYYMQQNPILQMIVALNK